MNKKEVQMKDPLQLKMNDQLSVTCYDNQMSLLSCFYNYTNYFFKSHQYQLSFSDYSRCETVDFNMIKFKD